MGLPKAGVSFNCAVLEYFLFLSGGSSIWTSLSNSSSTLPVDYYSQLEELFCQKAASPPTAASPAAGSRPRSAPATAASSPAAPPPSASPTINLLDSKRSLAINIFLKQFRGGPDAVLDTIRNGEKPADGQASQLTAERLRSLARLLPDKTEVILFMQADRNIWLGSSFICSGLNPFPSVLISFPNGKFSADLRNRLTCKCVVRSLKNICEILAGNRANRYFSTAQ